MEVNILTKPYFYDDESLVLESVANVVEYESMTSSSYDVILSQEFKGPELAVERKLFWLSPMDRAILIEEGAALDLKISHERDLHRLARQFFGPREMTLFRDRSQEPVLVMKSIRPAVRNIPSNLGYRPDYSLNSRHQ